MGAKLLLVAGQKINNLMKSQITPTPIRYQKILLSNSSLVNYKMFSQLTKTKLKYKKHLAQLTILMVILFKLMITLDYLCINKLHRIRISQDSKGVPQMETRWGINKIERKIII